MEGGGGSLALRFAAIGAVSVDPHSRSILRVQCEVGSTYSHCGAIPSSLRHSYSTESHCSVALNVASPHAACLKSYVLPTRFSPDEAHGVWYVGEPFDSQ